MDSESMFQTMGLGAALFYLAFIVVMIIANWKIFEKGGQPGWAVLIPFL